jgi:hypothetical protein
MGLGTRARGGNKKRYEGLEDKTYPVILPLEYRIYGVAADGTYEVRQAGSGRTLHMSSGGVLFEADRALPEGMDAELSIAWPASLSESVGLTLWVRGRIVDADQNRIALTMTHYEFRTRSLTAASERAVSEKDLAAVIKLSPDSAAKDQ